MGDCGAKASASLSMIVKSAWLRGKAHREDGDETLLLRLTHGAHVDYYGRDGLGPHTLPIKFG